MLKRGLSRALAPFPAARNLARRAYQAILQQDGDRLPEVDPNSPQFLTEALARFGARQLANVEGVEASRRAYSNTIQDALLILSSDAFVALPVPNQVEVMAGIHGTLMSGVPRESLAVAELMAGHFARLLRHAEITEALACRVYDCLYGFYFAGARSISDMRAFDSGCVIPFDEWLARRLPAAPQLQAQEGNIGYLVHCAHFEKGNAVSPIIASLAKAHSRRPGRRVFVYGVQWTLGDFAGAFAGSSVTVRTVSQDTRYDQIDILTAQMRADRLQVAVSDLNAAVGAALFARRVAPLQMWTVMGYPYWSLRNLDWTLLIGMEHQGGFGIPRDRVSYMRVRQEAQTLTQDVAEPALCKARAALPRDKFVFAVFSRLIKISDQMLAAAARVLRDEPRAHLLIVGTGDPRAIYDFAGQPELRGRITFLHGNVDLNVYGRLVDAMLDTFPFHGGNACREVAVHGKPVLSVLSPDWERLLRDERDPQLLARDATEYVAVALRLVRDRVFYQARAAEALCQTQHIVETDAMVEDVEAAIAKAA